MDKDEALKLALEYMNERLEDHDSKFMRHSATEAERDIILANIKEVKEALAQPAQEPTLQEQLAIAQAARDKAKAARDKANADLEKAAAACNKADADWDKADAYWEKALHACHKADAEIKRILKLMEQQNG